MRVVGVDRVDRTHPVVSLYKIKEFNGELDDLFGIFDGHGGYLVSLFCKIVFPEILAINLQKMQFDDK